MGEKLELSTGIHEISQFHVYLTVSNIALHDRFLTVKAIVCVFNKEKALGGPSRPFPSIVKIAWTCLGGIPLRSAVFTSHHIIALPRQWTAQRSWLPVAQQTVHRKAAVMGGEDYSNPDGVSVCEELVSY